MPDHRTVEDFFRLTVWIIKNNGEGWKAVRLNGHVVASNRIKSTLVHTVQQMASVPDNNIYAIAEVIYPQHRVPNAKPRLSRRQLRREI